MARRVVHLSRRERQIMDILYVKSAASAGEVQAAMADPPSYSAVRALLAVLEEKGHVKHRAEKGKYIYLPTTPRGRAAKSALKRVLETFFGGSMEDALAAHLADPSTKLSPEATERLTALIQQARQRGE